MRQRDVGAAIGVGAVLASVVIDVCIAVFGATWVLAPGIYGAAALLIVGIFWRWRSGPFQGDITRLLSPRVRAFDVVAVLACLFFEGVGARVVLGGLAISPVYGLPSVSRFDWHDWATVTVFGFLFVALVGWLMFAGIIGVLRLNPMRQR